MAPAALHTSLLFWRVSFLPPRVDGAESGPTSGWRRTSPGGGVRKPITDAAYLIEELAAAVIVRDGLLLALAVLLHVELVLLGAILNVSALCKTRGNNALYGTRGIAAVA